MKTTITLAMAALALSAGSAWARGDADAGAKKAAEACVACHGEGGAKPATPDYPILAGQPQDYLEHTLKSYKNGKRKNAIMSGMAAALSKEEIANLAAYFSKQKGLAYKY